MGAVMTDSGTLPQRKHTPGPWQIADRDGKYYGTEILGPGGDRICECWNHEREGGADLSPREMERLFPPGDHFMTDDERKETIQEWRCDSHYESAIDYANACLIAGAPDMLAALRTLVAVAVEPGADPDHFLEAVEGCRAAIARAEGTVL